ncbi:MAG: dihydroneopterin aldolase [SAR202 cluster bacterium]|nr:dihydroneopterin aldolase [SAR202 cluster bacterium]
MNDSSDKIILNNMKFFAYHGVHPYEKKNGQNFIVDLELYADLSIPSKSDNLNQTIDYSKVYETVKRIIEQDSKNLLESLCEDISKTLLESFKIDAVRIKIKKPDIKLSGNEMGYAAIEIFRTNL